MLTKTQGIVLKQVKYGDTSLIVKMYTRDYGLLSFMVKGVRSSRSKGKAAMMQPLMLLDLVLYLKSNQNLKSLREFQYSYVYRQLPYDIVRSTVGMFMLEVVLKSIKEEEPNTELFDFLSNAFHLLDEGDKMPPNFHLVFLAQLLEHIGFQPQGRFTEETACFDVYEGSFVADPPAAGHYLEPEDAGELAILLHTGLEHAENIQLSAPARKLLLDRLLLYYEYHVESFKQLRSPEILRSVLH
jgi:DNA repair protein RecO (recombination protein O)